MEYKPASEQHNSAVAHFLQRLQLIYCRGSAEDAPLGGGFITRVYRLTECSISFSVSPPGYYLGMHHNRTSVLLLQRCDHTRGLRKPNNHQGSLSFQTFASLLKSFWDLVGAVIECSCVAHCPLVLVQGSCLN